MPLSPLLAGYDNVLLDLDGCVWLGDAPTRRAGEAVAELRAAGKRLVFLTNNSQRTPEDYVGKLWSLGIQASLQEMLTTGSAVQAELAGREGADTYVIGAPSLFRHVALAGQRILNGRNGPSRAQVVVVAGHDEFDFGELRDATRALLQGAELLASDRDRTFPTPDGPCPGSGAIVAALEYATGAQARVVGKPQPEFFHAALERTGPGRTLMVGDRLDADLAGAAAAGMDGAIVLTGVTDREQALAAVDPAPVAVADDLYALVTGA